MAFTRSGVRSPSPPLYGCTAGRWGSGFRRRTYRGQPYTGEGLRVRFWRYAGIAQLVEHNLAKVGVAGSSPVSRSGRLEGAEGWKVPIGSTFHIPTVQHANGFSSDAGWSSLVARRAHNPEVVGSNPTPATSIADCGLGIADCARQNPQSENPQSAIR